MSDVLVVSGGGRITVAGDDLLVAIARCRLLAGRLEDVAPHLPPSALGARLRLGELALRLRTIAVLVSAALDGYSAAELSLTRAAESAAGEAAYWTAFLGPLALALVPPPILLAAAGGRPFSSPPGGTGSARRRSEPCSPIRASSPPCGWPWASPTTVSAAPCASPGPRPRRPTTGPPASWAGKPPPALSSGRSWRPERWRPVR
ncbi:hypothetical protein [Naasia aerilata]|uniref:Uncharacterized protein n=1 Tax=Naasia aerilata TaxID=1162966 RepID=A0ABM8GAV4_9MICO|nr:hypothetical protein [Naasia aerilata]BDZ45349.1 hypothetical protein GCM10025866_12580 [Naasia aerilata]